MSTAVVQTHELSKVFHHPFFKWIVRARALTTLNLTINKGEVFGLLGPNGSGKSTTIKLLLGLLFPTSGEISVLGRQPGDLSVKERIGYLPEESYLYRYLDAQETLDFYGRLFGLNKAERQQRTEALLDLVGLTAERQRPIAEYSKGMRRRIGLAQCLINDPEFVILDEPTTGLDPIGTAEIKRVIRELRDKGKTVLLCSHLLSEVEDVCDRVTILYGGKVQITGAVEDLVRKEQKTQITAEMDDETRAAVEAFLRERLGPEASLQVRPARERLEELFLRTIENAQVTHVETSGAAVSQGKSLDFLSGQREPALLDQLAQAETPQAEIVPAPVATPLAAADAGPGDPSVLDSLQAPSVEPVARPEKRVAELQDAQLGETDQALLDRLAGGS